MRRVIIHPGFHRTGTTSIQASLAQNRRLIPAFARVLLLDELGGVAASAQRFSRYKTPIDMIEFHEQLARALDRVSDDCETLVLSCEALCGLAPGRRGVADYAAAPELIEAIALHMQDRYGENVTLDVILTTRAADEFADSLWRHLLRTSPLTLDFVKWRAAYAGPLDLKAAAKAVTARLKLLDGQVSVSNHALETLARDKMGPVVVILKLLGLPPDVLAQFSPYRHANSGISHDLAAQMLASNRQITDLDAARAARDELARKAMTAAAER